MNTMLVTGARALDMVWGGDGPFPTRDTAPRGGRRDPVVLVGGFAVSSEIWRRYVASLQRDGYEVYVFDVPDNGLGDMRSAAGELHAFLSRIARSSATGKVDVVGYSEGGVLARMAVASGGLHEAIDAVVTLATPHRGVLAGALLNELHPVLGNLVPLAARQLAQGSSLLRQLDAADNDLRRRGRVRYTSIFSQQFDLVVYPRHSPYLEGAKNVVISERRKFASLFRGPDHLGILQHSAATYDAVRAALTS